MVNAANELFDQIHNTSSYLSHTLSPLMQFISHYIQTQETLERGRMYVTQLSTEFNQRVTELTELANGKLPISVIGPTHLQQILEEIHSLLPANIQLPMDHREHIATYYQFIKTTLVAEDNKLFGIAILPLVESSYKYELYSARSVETHYVDDDKNVHISAEYDLDHLHFIVSNDFTRFSVINDDVFNICSFEHLSFCPVKTPIYSAVTSKDSCTVDLFLHENNNNGACDVKIKHKKYDFPKIVHIRSGDWLVLTKTPVTFAVYCMSQNVKYIEVMPPLQHLNLDHGCHAVSQKVSIPAHFEDITKIDIPRNHFNFTIRKSFWKPIIDALNLDDPIIPDKVKTISEMGDMLSHLKNEIRRSPRSGSSFNYWHDIFKQLLISIVTTVMIIIIAEIVIWYGLIRKCKTQCFTSKTSNLKKGVSRSSNPLESDLHNQIADRESDILMVNKEDLPETSQALSGKNIDNYNMV
jgi:hypothetical protein